MYRKRYGFSDLPANRFQPYDTNVAPGEPELAYLIATVAAVKTLVGSPPFFVTVIAEPALRPVRTRQPHERDGVAAVVAEHSDDPRWTLADVAPGAGGSVVGFDIRSSIHLYAMATPAIFELARRKQARRMALALSATPPEPLLLPEPSDESSAAFADRCASPALPCALPPACAAPH